MQEACLAHPGVRIGGRGRGRRGEKRRGEGGEGLMQIKMQEACLAHPGVRGECRLRRGRGSGRARVKRGRERGLRSPRCPSHHQGAGRGCPSYSHITRVPPYPRCPRSPLFTVYPPPPACRSVLPPAVACTSSRCTQPWPQRTRWEGEEDQKVWGSEEGFSEDLSVMGGEDEALQLHS